MFGSFKKRADSRKNVYNEERESGKNRNSSRPHISSSKYSSKSIYAPSMRSRSWSDETDTIYPESSISQRSSRSRSSGMSSGTFGSSWRNGDNLSMISESSEYTGYAPSTRSSSSRAKSTFIQKVALVSAPVEAIRKDQILMDICQLGCVPGVMTLFLEQFLNHQSPVLSPLIQYQMPTLRAISATDLVDQPLIAILNHLNRHHALMDLLGMKSTSCQLFLNHTNRVVRL